VLCGEWRLVFLLAVLAGGIDGDLREPHDTVPGVESFRFPSLRCRSSSAAPLVPALQVRPPCGPKSEPVPARDRHLRLYLRRNTVLRHSEPVGVSPFVPDPVSLEVRPVSPCTTAAHPGINLSDYLPDGCRSRVCLHRSLNPEFTPMLCTINPVKPARIVVLPISCDWSQTCLRSSIRVRMSSRRSTPGTRRLFSTDGVMSLKLHLQLVVLDSRDCPSAVHFNPFSPAKFDYLTPQRGRGKALGYLSPNRLMAKEQKRVVSTRLNFGS